MTLEESVGKNIAAFCRNRFTGDGENHCAHFVSHVLEIDSGYTCKTHKNGHHPGACLRVQEIFARCPRVGQWGREAPEAGLVFVTDRANVDIAGHKMRNVPKKHVGIFCGERVYHYSNSAKAVLRQDTEAFRDTFQNAYGGSQDLFFGTFPPGARIPAEAGGRDSAGPAPAQPSPPVAFGAPRIRQVAVSGGRTDYYAAMPGAGEYYVARDTQYGAYHGLFQPASRRCGPVYEIGRFTGTYESLAALIGVIATGESRGRFNCLNSYDRAGFTFGFFQLAAHTPADNLILLFRRLAGENPTFQSLFGDLMLVDGVLHRLADGHAVSLETAYPRPGHPREKNLHDFMAYLNPDTARVDEAEVSAAARLVYLANTDEAANRIQVNLAAHITMGKLRAAYDPWYGLDGASDLVCTAIADIHHQSRGTKTAVRAALASGGLEQQLDALCRIGEHSYAERCATLKASLTSARQDGYLGRCVFDRASGLFRPAGGWSA